MVSKLICYRCGSEDNEFVRENSDSIVYRCKDCGKVIIKSKRGKEKWTTIKN